MSPQSFFQNISTTLRKPVYLAAFASVGVHAVIGATLSSLPVASSLQGVVAWEDEPQDVGLVELTPAEISRLPNLAPPPLPPLPELKPLPNISKLLPTRPQVSTSAFLPPPPSPSLLRLFQPGLRPVLPPRPTNIPRLPLPPRRTATRSNRITTPPPNGLEQSLEEWTRRRALFPNNPILNPETANPETDNLDDITKTPKVPVDAKPTPPETRSPEQIAAARIKQGENRIAALRQQYRKDDANTSAAEANVNAGQFIAQVGTQVKPESVTITGNYPKTACPLKIQNTVSTTYGILVNPNGSVVGSSFKLLRSSGYPIFNNQAASVIRGRSFANSLGQPKPYYISVNFTPNSSICPSSRPAPVTTPVIAPEVKPKPQLETPEAVTPQPQPQVTPQPETTEVVTPKPETPEVAIPQTETPEVAIPQTETPEVVTPKPETPEVVTPQPQPQPATPEVIAPKPQPQVTPQPETSEVTIPNQPQAQPEVQPQPATPEVVAPKPKPQPQAQPQPQPQPATPEVVAPKPKPQPQVQPQPQPQPATPEVVAPKPKPQPQVQPQPQPATPEVVAPKPKPQPQAQPQPQPQPQPETPEAES